jgi:hypothetical protein
MDSEKPLMPDAGSPKKNGVPVGMPKPPPERLNRKFFSEAEWAGGIEKTEKMAKEVVENRKNNLLHPSILPKVAAVVHRSVELGLSADYMLQVPAGKDPVKFYRGMILNAQKKEVVKIVQEALLEATKNPQAAKLLLTRSETVLSKLNDGKLISIPQTKEYLLRPPSLLPSSKQSSSPAAH